MAATLDNQLSQQHDLSHDTLMGLEELDSHLGMFEPSLDSARESFTPDAMSMSPADGSISSLDQASQTIIVDAPGDSYSRKYYSAIGSTESRAKATDGKNMSTVVTQYVLNGVTLWPSIDICDNHHVFAHMLTSLVVGRNGIPG
jgi:hypothetical protein